MEWFILASVLFLALAGLGGRRSVRGITYRAASDHWGASASDSPARRMPSAVHLGHLRKPEFHGTNARFETLEREERGSCDPIVIRRDSRAWNVRKLALIPRR